MPKPRKGTQEKETSIQAAICDYLAIRQNQGKLMFWRQNNNPIFHDGRMRALPKYARHGIPDIFVLTEGTFVGLEVKRKGGKQSPAQVEFENDIKEHGGEYYVVRSVDEVQQIGL